MHATRTHPLPYLAGYDSIPCLIWQLRAADLMTKSVVSCAPTDTMDHARALMNRVQLKGTPVLTPTRALALTPTRTWSAWAGCLIWQVVEDGMLLGMLKYRDVVKAAQQGKGGQHVKAWMRREVDPCKSCKSQQFASLYGEEAPCDRDGCLIWQVVKVLAETTFAELEAAMTEGQPGRIPVVDRDGRMLGIVTRTDLLRQSELYGSMQRRVA